MEEKYLINTEKTDLMSCLRQLDKKIINKALKDNALDSIDELCKYIIDNFEFLLDMTKDDLFTVRYFERLLQNEKTMLFSSYQSDIETLLVFVGKTDKYYYYIIPDEIKKIIKKLL